MHKWRFAALSVAVGSALDCAHISITSIGRNLSGKAMIKHKIKRTDRLVGNQHLLNERRKIYGTTIIWLLKHVPTVVVLIDWSPISLDQRQYPLRASLPVGGRSLTLYEEVHSRKKNANRKVQHRFLDTLKALLPADMKPIIVADSGFRVPFYQKVETLGWLWVARIRNRDMISTDAEQEQWFRAKELYADASTRPKKLRSILWTKRNGMACVIALVKAKRQGRKSLTQTGKQARCAYSLKQAKRESEPWLLAGCPELGSCTAKQIVALYKTRMQIEEGFRDTKSNRFGFWLADASRISIQRRMILLLIASLANIIAWCLGTMNRGTNLESSICVNTKPNNAFSTTFFGVLLWRYSDTKLTLEKLRRAQQSVGNHLAKVTT
jgi:hypothetical protein